MKNLSTLIKLSTLLIIGGGTVGAAVGVTEAQMRNNDIVENDEFVHAAEIIHSQDFRLRGNYNRLDLTRSNWDANVELDSKFNYQINVKDSHVNNRYVGYFNFSTGDEFWGYHKDFYHSDLNDKFDKKVTYNSSIFPSEYFEGNGSNVRVKTGGVYKLVVKPCVENNNWWYEWESVTKIDDKIEFVYSFINDPNLSKTQLHIFDDNKNNLTVWQQTENVVSKDSDGLFKVDLTAQYYNGYNRVTIVADKWNTSYHSSDINYNLLASLHNDYNLIYKIKATDDGYFDISPKAVENFTKDKARLWVDNYDADSWANLNTINAWNANNHVEIPILNKAYVRDDNSRQLKYVDVPVNLYDGSYRFNIKIYDNNGMFKYSSVEKDFETLNPAKIHYFHKGGDGQFYINQNNINTNQSYGYKIDAKQFVPILEGYFTCLNSKLNGYGAVHDFVETWIGTWNEKQDIDWKFVVNNLSDVKIKDYENYKIEDYSTGANKTKDTDLWTKLDSMIKMQKGQPLPVETLSNNLFSKENMPFTITTVAVLGLSTIAMVGFVFLNKKRKPLIK